MKQVIELKQFKLYELPTLIDFIIERKTFYLEAKKQQGPCKR